MAYDTTAPTPKDTPDALAQALLRGPVTPERVKKLLWHAKKGTRAEFDQLLLALPADLRAQVETMAARVPFPFRG